MEMNLFCKSLALALVVSLHSSAHAAAERRLQIGFATISPIIAPLWVAADRRFFAQEGLEPELVFIGSAPTLVASLIAREVPFASTAGTAVMSAVAGGAPLKILATINNRSTYDLVARPGITRPEDLRGKRVGVQSIGGGILKQGPLGLENPGLAPVKGRLPNPGDGPLAPLADAPESRADPPTAPPNPFC